MQTCLVELKEGEKGKVKISENELVFKGSFKVRMKTEKLVIHHSASGNNTTIQDIHSWHLANGWIGIGYHYVIYADGTVYRGRPEWAIGAHAYQDATHEANSDGIGICLIGNFTLASPSSDQMESLIGLVFNIWQRYPNIRVIGHKDVMATACPGELFPWTELYTKLANGVIDVVLEKWMIEGGQAALRELADKGLVNNPGNWSSEDKLAEYVPAYLLWMMMIRLANYKEG